MFVVQAKLYLFRQDTKHKSEHTFFFPEQERRGKQEKKVNNITKLAGFGEMALPRRRRDVIHLFSG
jgi:hypothetical protein